MLVKERSGEKMKIKLQLPWNKPVDDEELFALEACLQAALQPVSLKPSFVRYLRQSLMNYPAPAQFPSTSKLPQYAAVFMASLFSGAALVGIAIWAILALVGRQQSQGKSTISTPRPAL
jgi:hypothetical protein